MKWALLITILIVLKKRESHSHLNKLGVTFNKIKLRFVLLCYFIYDVVQYSIKNISLVLCARYWGCLECLRWGTLYFSWPPLCQRASH